MRPELLTLALDDCHWTPLATHAVWAALALLAFVVGRRTGLDDARKDDDHADA